MNKVLIAAFSLVMCLSTIQTANAWENRRYEQHEHRGYMEPFTYGLLGGIIGYEIARPRVEYVPAPVYVQPLQGCRPDVAIQTVQTGYFPNGQPAYSNVCFGYDGQWHYIQ